jgi:hypothetical protein
MIDRKPMQRVTTVTTRTGPKRGNTPMKPRPKWIGHALDCHCEKCEPPNWPGPFVKGNIPKPPEFMEPVRKWPTDPHRDAAPLREFVTIFEAEEKIHELRSRLLVWQIVAMMLAGTLAIILCLLTKYSP